MENTNGFKRKRIRVKGFEYKGGYSYFLTICTANKTPYFLEKDIVDFVLCHLRSQARMFDFSIYAYCFMPDHLHLLLNGNKNADLSAFIRSFKQITGYHFKKTKGNNLWQRSYFDHVIRNAESMEEITEYIFLNPVRKGIVDDFRKYPFSGSFEFEAC